MSETNNQVADQMVVTLEYTLRLEDDQIIDQSDGGAPLEYIQGLRQIIPGLENELYGMSVGDEKDVIVDPLDGYGIFNPEDIVQVPRARFPDSVNLTVGEPVSVRDDETGHSFSATIVDVRPDSVFLDFNHPLAGKTLYFNVKIADLRPATDEELSHGHVHSPGHSHE